MEYVNLDLELSDYQRETDQERFRVHVVKSDFGNMSSDNATPVSLTSEQRKWISRLKNRGLTMQEIIERGEELGKMLFPPDSQVRRIYEKCLDGLKVKDDQRLRIRLTLGNYALSDLPWEYTYVPPQDTPEDQKSSRGFLVLNKRISLVRYPAIEGRMISLNPVEKGKVRMVVIMANPKNDPNYRELELGAEFEKIKKTLANVPSVTAEPFPDATIETLQDALMRPAHIFHFAGHGGFQGDLGTTTSGQGFIVLLDDHGQGDKFPADKLAGFLCANQVRLAVLTACETGETDQINAWTGVVPALIREGIPAVVGMQFTIQDENAIAFSRAFYYALFSEGLSIDAAVAEGRLAIEVRGDERDWGVPVLYLRADEGTLFPNYVNAGLILLGDQIEENPAIRDLVCRSKEKINDVANQISKMDLFKTIHDALHDIECDCLQPMEAGKNSGGLGVFNDEFEYARQKIEEAIKGRETLPLLQNLTYRLKSVAADFQGVAGVPEDAALKKVASGLTLLVSKFPPMLDSHISVAAEELNLNSLVELLAQVCRLVADAKLKPFLQSIEDLRKMRDEVADLVSKHYTLQSLNTDLRALCVAEDIPGNLDLASQWSFIKQERSGLASPDTADKRWARYEGAIDEAITRNNQLDAMDHLKAYLALVIKEFRNVDGDLKNFCGRLSGLNPTLQVLLNLC